MNANADDAVRTRVFTTRDGGAVIEQSGNSVGLTADEILAVIEKLHLCYDYCAAWRDTESDDTADKVET